MRDAPEKVVAAVLALLALALIVLPFTRAGEVFAAFLARL